MRVIWALLACWTLISPVGAVNNDLADRFEAARLNATVLEASHPLYLTSSDTQDILKGEIFTTLDRPFSLIREVTTRPEDWCHILILHLNIKYCRAAAPTTPATSGAVLVGMGRKYDQPLDDVYWIRFNYRVVQVTADHLLVELAAPVGPLGTRDYRLQVEAIPLSETRSLMSLTYSQSYGLAARWTFQVYLATLGRGKVGFSALGNDAQGRPLWVEGLRGVLERNAMRYHLAIEAWLGQQHLPPAQRMEASLKSWFDATEKFPRQLREISWPQYLSMKRREVARLSQWPMPKKAEHHWLESP